MRKILLSLIIILVTSVAFAGEFIRDYAADTVTDSTNSLMWQDNAVVASATYTWTEAIDYCENLDFAGQTDWQLPTINELRSIVDYDAYNLAIVSLFLNAATSLYWSSTTSATNTSSAWSIHFNYGGGYGSSKTSNNYVRCVR